MQVWEILCNTLEKMLSLAAAWLEDRRWNQLQYHFMDSAIEIEDLLDIEIYRKSPSRHYKTDLASSYFVGQVMFTIIAIALVGAILVGIIN